MKQRAITGVIAGALFLSFLYYGGIAFYAFIILISTYALYECFSFLKETNRWERIVSWVFMMAILLPFAYLNEHLLSLFIATIGLWFFGAVVKKKQVDISVLSQFLFFSLYIGIGFLAFLTFREEHGFLLCLTILCMVWGTDTGAYFSGRFLGKHKLLPEISPKKTWEGSIGGVIASIIVILVFHYTLDAFVFLNVLQLICMGVLVSIVAQVGDLIESAVKRQYKVKDSGKILPGHGGIFDRFDSVLLVFPIILLFF